MLKDIRLLTYREITPSFMVIPMVSHWILPAAIEMKLYLTIMGIPLYLFNLFYLLYILSYPYFKDEEAGNFCSRFRVAQFCFLFWFICLLTALVNYAEPLLPIIFNAYPIVWLAPLMTFFPLSDKQIQSTKYVMAFALVFLCAEIFLYATGTLTYRSINTGTTLTGQQYAGGIMRISTTIGGATGTAIIVAWLSTLCLSVYKFSPLIKWLLYVLSTIAIFYTVSRGAIIVWIVYSSYYLYINYLKYSHLRTKVFSMIAVAIVVSGLNYLSVFNAIMDRNNQLANNIATGRNIHVERSIKIIEESNGLGVGTSMMFPEKSIQGVVIPKKREASHNVYLIVTGETGIVGLLLFTGIILTLLFNVTYTNPLSIFLWLTLLVNFNTEGVILTSEFIALYIFMLMTIQKRNFDESIVYIET